MSKLNVDQKTIKDLFQSKKSDFLIPDYQRPYAWGEAECRTLWDDIFSFAIPDEGKTEFDSNSEYFLGPIVTFRNEDKLEVIDGQQRLTTLMLLLRAFYSKFGHMQDKASISTKQNIEKCLWKTDEFGEPDMSQLKIDSEVATDNDKEEFLEILRTGIVNKEMKSKYACNFRFFQNNIDEFLSKYPTYFAYLPTRIMNNCILLPIEAESQDTALRIFSTLTERFSNRVLKQFFVLNYAPNGMWTYFVSVYFMQNKDDEGLLDDEKFYTFLQKITGFIWTYAITNPGVNALRTPVYAEMVNIVNDKPVEFSKYKFDADTIRSMFDNFSFNNARPITKAMIAWWAYQNDKQPLLSLETTFEIEHIYARNRNEKENSLTDARNVESLGNKALLEKRINIRASDYRFTDKKKYYEGFTNSKGQIKEGTGVVELLDLTATSADFTENDIIDRYKKMIDCFINYLQKNSLIK